LDGDRLRHGAAPSLPKAYSDAIDGLTIGPSEGSCGTAASRAEPVIVSDISTDPLWEKYRDLASKHSLRACWSTPIFSSRNKVLGTFALYYHEPRGPGQRERELIEQLTHIAGVAIQRKKAEEELRTSEEKYRDLINSSPDAILVTDADGRCVLSNPAGATLAGHAQADLVGSDIGDTYLPEERHLFQNRLDKLRTEKFLRYERRFVRKNGDLIPVEVSVSGLRDGYSQAILRDISERKRAEQDLRRSQEYLTEGQRISHTGSWAWNTATGGWFWSPEALRIFGIEETNRQFSFEMLLERVHPEDRSKMEHAFSRRRHGKEPFEYDIRALLPSGVTKHLHFLGRPVFDDSGELGEFIGVVMDITERKHAEEALRASEQVARGQVEALAQSLDVLATAHDPHKFISQMLTTIGRLLNAQSVSLWLFDESNDSLTLRLSTSDGDSLPSPDPEHPFIKNPSFWKENAVVQELLFTAGPVVCDNVETDPRVSGDWGEHLKRSGTKRFLVVPLLVGGHVRGFVGIRHVDQVSYRPEDIELTQALAHQVMLAIQLNEFAEQSQRAAIFEERNRMARDIHDTLAQGFTGVIVQLEAAEDAISCSSRKEAENHLRRAGELARRSLSEARRSVHALRPQALQEHNFWEALKGSIKSTTVGTAIHATFEAQGKLPELPQPWQENLLRIGQEALTNTLKYAHARSFKTRLTYKAKELRLELRDDGNGFKVKDRHDGAGLSGMRERVEQMGGELEIASARGKGTKVIVVVPCNGESIS
jgi:PAS domain S-box-containing protein